MTFVNIAAYGVGWIDVSLIKSFLTTKWEFLEYTGHKMGYGEVNAQNPTVVIAFLPPADIMFHESINKVITPGAGVDVLPLETLKEKGIEVINCHANANTVAEHAWGLLMTASRKIVKYHQIVSDQEAWPPRSQITDRAMDLSGKTIGIVGFGAIGRRIADFATAFNMEIAIFRNHPVEGQYNQEELIEHAEDLDVLMLACPLTSKTRGMVNKSLLDRLPAHTVLVNIARGELIEEEALIDALHEGTIRAAALDVWHNSPYKYSEAGMPPEDFVGTPGLVISPHRAWVSKESVVTVAKELATELDIVAKGKRSDNVLDYEKGY